MKNKVIIFDLDGVLFDSTKLVNALFMTSYPTMTQGIMNKILSGNFHDELEKFKLTNTPLEETPEQKEARFASYEASKRKTPLYDGIKELLQKLHDAGCILTINTSALERNCLPLLEYSQIKNLFDFVATKEVSKSKVEKFKIILEKYGVTKDEVVFITDTLGDIREAEEAEIPSIAVTWGAHKKDYFRGEKHHNLIAIVDSISQLESVIITNTSNPHA